MAVSPRIAIDAMGGDIGPAVMIAGMARARRKDRSLRFEVFGDEAQIAPELAKHQPLVAAVALHHSPTRSGVRKAEPGDPPRQDHLDGPGDQRGEGRPRRRRAVRRQYRRDDGHGQAGAAHHAGIDRPALAALLPTLGTTDCVMLDLGANTECDAQNLVQFAVMGSAYSRTVLGIAKPRVKLLNIGTEELKGTDELKEAAALLRDATTCRCGSKASPRATGSAAATSTWSSPTAFREILP